MTLFEIISRMTEFLWKINMTATVTSYQKLSSLEVPLGCFSIYRDRITLFYGVVVK